MLWTYKQIDNPVVEVVIPGVKKLNSSNMVMNNPHVDTSKLKNLPVANLSAYSHTNAIPQPNQAKSIFALPGSTNIIPSVSKVSSGSNPKPIINNIASSLNNYKTSNQFNLNKNIAPNIQVPNKLAISKTNTEYNNKQICTDNKPTSETPISSEEDTLKKLILFIIQILYLFFGKMLQTFK